MPSNHMHQEPKTRKRLPKRHTWMLLNKFMPALLPMTATPPQYLQQMFTSLTSLSTQLHSIRALTHPCIQILLCHTFLFSLYQLIFFHLQLFISSNNTHLQEFHQFHYLHHHSLLNSYSLMACQTTPLVIFLLLLQIVLPHLVSALQPTVTTVSRKQYLRTACHLLQEEDSTSIHLHLILQLLVVVLCALSDLPSLYHSHPPHHNNDYRLWAFSEQCSLVNTIISNSEDMIYCHLITGPMTQTLYSFDCFNTTVAGCIRTHNHPRFSPELLLSYRKLANAECSFSSSSTDCTSTSRVSTSTNGNYTFTRATFENCSSSSRRGALRLAIFIRLPDTHLLSL